MVAPMIYLTAIKNSTGHTGPQDFFTAYLYLHAFCSWSCIPAGWYAAICNAPGKTVTYKVNRAVWVEENHLVWVYEFVPISSQSQSVARQVETSRLEVLFFDICPAALHVQWLGVIMVTADEHLAAQKDTQMATD